MHQITAEEAWNNWDYKYAYYYGDVLITSMEIHGKGFMINELIMVARDTILNMAAIA